MNKYKTLNEVIADNPQHAGLIKAVIKQTGHDQEDAINELQNVIGCHCGAAGGFSGFIWYSETVPFAHKNRARIIKLLEVQAESMGVEVVEMVSSFGIFNRNGMDKDDRRDLYRFLGGGKCKETTIPNIMAWYALEEVARMFEA